VADRAALESLAGWCERFSPLAAADPPDGAWLDITGCAHLFAGEAALATLPVALLRLGLRLVAGFRPDWPGVLRGTRGSGFPDFPALAEAGLSQPVLVALSEADALRSLGLDRRAGLWQVRGLDGAHGLPLFAALPVQVRTSDPPYIRRPEQVVADYQTTGLSLKVHPLRFLRPALISAGVRSCAEATVQPDGTRLRAIGVVLVRQCPGSASGVVFVTIEDETGIAAHPGRGHDRVSGVRPCRRTPRLPSKGSRPIISINLARFHAHAIFVNITTYRR
jgi:hypothetical protein